MFCLKSILLSLILLGNRLIIADPPPLIVDIDENGVLQSINATEIPTDLDLSGLSISHINESFSYNLLNVTTLNLANNNITDLPESVFSKLVNLQNLSLSNNGLRVTKNAFVGLGNLTILDLSSNPLQEVLDDNCFFGLTQSCDISIKGSSGVKKIGSNAFGNKPSTSNSTVEDTSASFMQRYTEKLIKQYGAARGRREISISTFSPQLCMENNVVKSLDDQDPEKSSLSCSPVKFEFMTLWLNEKGIKDLEEGWYRLQDVNKVPSTLSALSLKDNQISRVPESLNQIPDYIDWLDLQGNKIERLEKKSFVHPKIFSLELSNNLISDIQDGAFRMPKLKQLFLGGNRLTTTRFAATLPSSLVSLYLDLNDIAQVPPNSFCHLRSLSYLNLNGNKLKAVEVHYFRGATSLGQLFLKDNEIETIEAGSFEDVGAWQILLENNNISSIENDTFKGLTKLQQINLNKNKLTKIGRDYFDLPKLRLLQLSENNITDIEKGAMRKMADLEEIEISKNPIKRLDNGALFGINKNRSATVEIEETPIEIIQGGVFDDV